MSMLDEGVHAFPPTRRNELPPPGLPRWFNGFCTTSVPQPLRFAIFGISGPLAPVNLPRTTSYSSFVPVGKYTGASP
jgi:hypothetical protein